MVGWSGERDQFARRRSQHRSIGLVLPYKFWRRPAVVHPQGRDVTGAVRLFAKAGPVPGFFTPPAGNSALIFFDVTYTDPARIPQLLSHAIR